MKQLLFYGTLFVFLAGSCVKTPGYFAKEPIPTNGQYSEPILDSLVQVQGGIQTPYDYVCRYNVNRRKGIFFGANSVSSGALLQDGVMITAAHNFYSTWYNKAKGVRIECGIGSQPNQTATYSELNLGIDNQIYVSSNYKWGPFSEDVSFVRICDSQSQVPTASPFRIVTKEELREVKEGKEIYVSGYPAEKPYTGSVLIHLKTTIKVKESGIIEYAYADTYGGMSGSPIWYLNDQDERIIIGVHVRGGGGGYILSETVIDEVTTWKNETNACSTL